jgi:hypothetical protein
MPEEGFEIFSPLNSERLGTDVMILKIFSQNNLAKKWRFLPNYRLVLEKNYHNIGF